jgi:hypothetical protein
MAGQSNFQDVVQLNQGTITAGVEALIIGTDAGSKSLIFAQDTAQASALFVVASNPTSQATQIHQFANGTIGLISAISAGAAAFNNGQLVVSNANGISFGINGSTLTASFSTADVTGLGVSNVGNTAGNTATTYGRIVFAGGANITLSQTTAVGSLATISIIGAAAAAGVAIAGGTQTGTSGTVVFSNSNLFTFGLSNSSIMTASFGLGIGVSNIGNTAGNTKTQQGTLVLAGAGGVSLSQSTAANAATISISMTQSTSPGGIAVAGSTATSGTVVFSNSNNVTFGMNGNTVTASMFDAWGLWGAY